MTRVTIGEEDAPQWLRVQRWPDQTLYLQYLEGIVTISTFELPATLAAELGAELSGVEPVRTEYRATYPQQILPDSPLEYSAGDQEHAEGIVRYVNRRLAAAGLPETAHVETRELYATRWTSSERNPSTQSRDDC